MGRGKSKGSSFEREISKDLTIGLTGMPKPYCFGRTHASGAIMTMDSCNINFAGDIMGISEEAHKIMSKIVIECKVGYNQISLDKFFKNNKNDLLKDFGDQVTEESEGSGKEPFLIYKKSGLPTIVMFRKDILKRLNKKLLDEEYISIKGKGYNELVLFNFNLFLEIVKPKSIMEL